MADRKARRIYRGRDRRSATTRAAPVAGAQVGIACTRRRNGSRGLSRPRSRGARALRAHRARRR